MAKLSEDVLEVGRERLRAGDLEGFVQWMRTTPIQPDEALVRRTIGTCLAARNVGRALKLFDALWAEIDPVEELYKKLFNAGVGLFVILGLLGGVAALVKVLFGG